MTSLRVKIAAGMAIVALIATAAVGVVTYRTTSARLVDEVDRSITEAISTLSSTGGGRVSVPSRTILEIYSVRRLDSSGDVVQTSFATEIPVDARALEVLGAPRAQVRGTVEADGSQFRVLTVGTRGGGVQVARSLDEVDSVLDDLRRRIALLVVLVSIAAAAVGWFLATTVAAPLRRLSNAAAEVERTGQLDVEVPGTGDDEVGRLGTSFRSMLRALHRSRSEQQRLVQDAGHELRTPLTSLRTNLTVLRRYPDMEAEMKQRILDDLDGEVSELTDLVNELVAVASGELLDEPAIRLDLREVAADVVERLGRRHQREIRLSAARAGSTVVVAPRAAIERAIVNLVTNAVKFDQSGAAIDVDVAPVVREGAPVVRLDVSDRGPGIPADEQEVVFERFHRAVDARTMPGSGLGLAIVSEIVERHGGTASAHDRPGGGATVGFELPAAPPEPVDGPIAPAR